MYIFSNQNCHRNQNYQYIRNFLVTPTNTKTKTRINDDVTRKQAVLNADVTTAPCLFQGMETARRSSCMTTPGHLGGEKRILSMGTIHTRRKLYLPFLGKANRVQADFNYYKYYQRMVYFINAEFWNLRNTLKRIKKKHCGIWVLYRSMQRETGSGRTATY